MLLARVGNIAARPRWLATRVTRLHARILRLSRGRLRRSLFLAGGQPVLVLTTKGRRTGRPRSTPVAYMRDGDDLVIVPGNAGLRRPPAWWLNLQADPQAEVEVGGRSLFVRARRAQPLEEARLWPRLVRQFAGHEQTRRMAGRDIPVVILQAVGLEP
jgi:F420H(2)-dependent quinone reductase